jgi:hypothetical protein
MPVYAEQKEPTTFDRVVESTEIASPLKAKEETPLNVATADTMISEKIEAETSSLMVEVAPITSPEQHIIIFDWDDTLLASSFLASQGYRLDVDIEKKENYEFVKNELKLLETCVSTLLDEALQRGKVHIITNAETGWVELSAQKFMPSIVPYLSKVTLISARSTYEHLYPGAPVKWKYSAMYDSLSHLMNDECRKNVLSFGDSHVEREAVRTVTKSLTNTRTKSIKFAECPNTEQLRKQLELVANCFHYIFTHEGDLDLMLKMSMVPATPSPTSPTPATPVSV